MNDEGEFRLGWEEDEETKELVCANPIVIGGVNHIIDVDFDRLENLSVARDKFIPIFQNKPPLTFTMVNGEKEAVVDFDGDEVTYSGDLPLDESAKLFFDAVFQQFKPRCKTCRWYDSEVSHRMCSCPKMVYGYRLNYSPNAWAKEDDDILAVEDDEGWGMNPKHNFGCIHHEEKL